MSIRMKRGCHVFHKILNLAFVWNKVICTIYISLLAKGFTRNVLLISDSNSFYQRGTSYAPNKLERALAYLSSLLKIPSEFAQNICMLVLFYISVNRDVFSLTLCLVILCYGPSNGAYSTQYHQVGNKINHKAGGSNSVKMKMRFAYKMPMRIF